MNCPDHGLLLTIDAHGTGTCARCGGALISSDRLASMAPGVLEKLSFEQRIHSGAFTTIRPCPQCAMTMAPRRLGTLDAWLEHCTACEFYWADKQDLRTLSLLARHQRRSEAMAALSPVDRQELASGLVAQPVRDVEGELSPIQFALALFGIPALIRKEGDREPLATWFLSVTILVVFLLGLAFPATLGAEALGMSRTNDGLAGAFTATFVHFGWLHLLGNLGFLLAFGDGVEQKLPRAGYLGLFVVAGIVTTVLQAAADDGLSLIGGASGAIAAVMGACLLLQPRAWVFFYVLRLPIRMPLLVFGACWLAFQIAMLMMDSEGVGWVAHISGIGLGFGVAAAIRLRPMRSRV